VFWEDRRQKRNPKEDMCPHYSDFVMRGDIKMPLHNECRTLLPGVVRFNYLEAPAGKIKQL